MRIKIVDKDLVCRRVQKSKQRSGLHKRENSKYRSALHESKNKKKKKNRGPVCMRVQKG